MSDSTTGSPVHLTAILAQFDRDRYPRAVERLIAQLHTLGATRAHVIVVDNAHTGDWSHEVSPNLTHIGGDNDAWEFSAFDRGMDFATSGGTTPDVFLLVTDAFEAYGDSYLELLDDGVVRAASELGVCVGWMDGFEEPCEALSWRYRDWVRSSFVLLPGTIRDRLGRVTTEIDPAALFGPSPDEPFLADAPLSESLRKFMLAWLTTTSQPGAALEESWHSRFELTEDTWDLFRSKAQAILREHLLSARLDALHVPRLDLRLFARLADRGLGLEAITEAEQGAWKGRGWEAALVDLPPLENMETVAIPSIARHGETSPGEVTGWVASRPRLEEVVLRFAPGLEVRAACDQLRHDVAYAHPEFEEAHVGYRVHFDAGALPPGVYEPRLLLPGLAVSHPLPTIRVLARATFVPRSVYLPEHHAPGEALPFEIEGVLEISHPVDEVRVRWDGQRQDATVRSSALGTTPEGLHRFAITAGGRIPKVESAAQHVLELAFLSGGAVIGHHRERRVLRADGTAQHALATCLVGPFDPATGRVRLQLTGAVLAHEHERPILVLEDARKRAIFELALDGKRAGPGGFLQLDVDECIVGGGPGPGEFRLGLRAHAGADPVALRTWQQEVTLARPRIHVDDITLFRQTATMHGARLALSGWVEHDGLVERLDALVDGHTIASLPLVVARPDITASAGGVRVPRVGFSSELQLRPETGGIGLELLAHAVGGTVGRWFTRVEVPPTPRPPLLVDSPDLDELEASDKPVLWPALEVIGHLERSTNARSTLEVNGEVVDHAVLDEHSGRFALAHTVGESGEHEVRVRIETDTTQVYDSGVRSVDVRPITVPSRTVDVLEHFLDAFSLRAKLPEIGPMDRFAHRMLCGDREFMSERIGMIDRIGRALDRYDACSGDATELPTRRPDRALRVLLPYWQMPAPHHGGGTWLLALLAELGRRHEITVIHPYGPGDERWLGWIEPLVTRTVAVNRRVGLARHGAAGTVPASHLMDYVPGLKSAIETELHGGHYDVVDYHYTHMHLHRSQAPIPSVLTVYESRVEALLASARPLARRSSDDDMHFLEQLLEEVHFAAARLANGMSALITPTEEEASLLRRLQGEAPVFQNSIGLDPGRFPEQTDATAEARGRAPWELLFLGNFKHPPNVDAALMLTEHVMPGVIERFPQAVLRLVGAHPPPVVERLAQRPGIEVTGEVRNPIPHLERASAFVAPITTGAGMRVKILDALASAVPVVTTELGARGIDGRDGKHYLIANSPEATITAISLLFDDPDRAQQIGAAGRHWARSKHSIRERAQDRECIWQWAMDRPKLEGDEGARDEAS